jgi:hypothetical protein
VKKSGITPQGLLDRPEEPEGTDYLYNLYAEISKGAEKVGYRELHAYQEVTGEKLTLFEIGIILDIDLLRRKHG